MARWRMPAHWKESKSITELRAKIREVVSKEWDSALTGCVKQLTKEIARIDALKDALVDAKIREKYLRKDIKEIEAKIEELTDWRLREAMSTPKKGRVGR
jgi:septal ring factor EnvC (AmiA/AmiB activator)